MGRGIEHQADFGANRDTAGLRGGQKEGHIHIAQIDEIKHAAARGEHFARLSDAILDPAVAWRLQGTVIDIRRDALDCGTGGFLQ